MGQRPESRSWLLINRINELSELIRYGGGGYTGRNDAFVSVGGSRI